MTELPHVTMVVVDTKNYGQAINAIQKSLKHVKPAKTIFFTDIVMESLPDGVEIRHIEPLYSKKAYSDWMMKQLGKQTIETSHVLVIQHDGFVLDGTAWDDAYLQYDYIGAPWLEVDGFNVGNGGFSLRSMKLHRAMAQDDTIIGIQPEDVGICRIYHDYLEQKYNIKFSPEPLAHKFSFELHEPKDKTFGFHGNFRTPYVEPIVLKRSGAMGDVIGVEPVLEYFFSKGHPVYLDTPEPFYQLFGRHHFPVGHYSKFDKDVIKHRYINLDMAYEVSPRQLHLKSYFEMCGIQQYRLKKPRLKFDVIDSNRLFKRKYVVIHIDDRETPHRNVYDIDWTMVARVFKALGYTVIQIGHGPHENIGLYFNTVNPVMLLWLIAGADLFFGIDSGPSHIAVACGVKSILFFGSVNPAYIHPDMSNIHVIQNPCPIKNDFCWHSSPGTTGSECAVPGAKDRPPCCVFDTDQVMEAIKRIV